MNYAEIKYHDIANGEGIRVSLFVSGCTHKCKGCFNQSAWNFAFGDPFTTEIENNILEAMSPDYINGLTLLGGEPMEPENQLTLYTFLKRAKSRFPDKSIWCYTGYLFDDELLVQSRATTVITHELLKLIDIMVDGKFILHLKDISLRFKGSSNQRIIDVQKSLLSDKLVLSHYNDKR